MGKIKNWMMDMQDQVDSAINNGAANEEEVLAYVKNTMPVLDSSYIKSQAKGRLGETENVLTRQEMLEQDVTNLEQQLHSAYTRIHDLHDVINSMKQLNQDAVDNLNKSISITNERWKNEEV